MWLCGIWLLAYVGGSPFGKHVLMYMGMNGPLLIPVSLSLQMGQEVIIIQWVMLESPRKLKIKSIPLTRGQILMLQGLTATVHIQSLIGRLPMPFLHAEHFL